MEDEIPDVSIVMRAHDPSRIAELRGAINSVISQSYGGRIEVVLETVNFPILPIIYNTKYKNIEINHQNNVFEGDSRTYLLRRGIKRARAPFMMFLDSDDVLYPEAVALLISSIPKESSIIIANVDVTDSTGARRRFPYHNFTPEFSDILTKNSIPIHSYMVRSKIAKQAGEKIPNLEMYEDYALLLHILSQGRPSFLEPFIPIATYFIHSDLRQKYAYVRAFSEEVISRIKNSLTFPMHPSDFYGKHSDVLGELVRELPERHIAPDTGMVEVCAFANGITIVEGWCAHPGQIFAQDSNKRIHSITHRNHRSDVDHALGRDTGLAGFSGILPVDRIEQVFAVIHNFRIPLPLV